MIQKPASKAVAGKRLRSKVRAKARERTDTRRQCSRQNSDTIFHPHSNLVFDGHEYRENVFMQFPSAAQPIAKLEAKSFVLDGGIVALDADGHSNFNAAGARGQRLR